MSDVHIGVFRGARPRYDPKLLDIREAQVAENAKLWSGALDSFFAEKAVFFPTLNGFVRSIYWLGKAYWLTWLEDVDVARPPIAGNTNERVYFTGTDIPRQTDLTLATTGDGTVYPKSSYQLGVPAPVAIPLVVLGAGGSGTPRGLAYVFTFVTAWGEEGPPSEPSEVLVALPGQEIKVSGLTTAPAGDHNIVKKRLYRVLAGETDESYRFVVELDILVDDYTDLKEDIELVEAIESTEWIPPPADLQGICAHPNNFLVGFRDNELWFSELNVLYAWPRKYMIPLDQPIVAIGVIGQSVGVATTASPYVVTGGDPASMSAMKLSSHIQPCVAKRAAKVMGNGLVYPTPTGLFAIGPDGSGLMLTRNVITEDEWKTLNPELMHAAVHDNRYYCWFETGIGPGIVEYFSIDDGVFLAHYFGQYAFSEDSESAAYVQFDNLLGAGFIFDPNEQNGEFTTLDFFCYAAHRDLETDFLFMFREEDRVRSIRQWEGDRDRRQTYRWRSRIQRTNPASMTAAKVQGVFHPLVLFDFLGIGYFGGAPFAELPFAEDGHSGETTPATAIFRYYGDGVLRHEETVTNQRPFRMPDSVSAAGVDQRAIEHVIEIEGTMRVRDARIAETVTELRERG